MKISLCNGKKVRGNGYVVDDFTDHAIDFIEVNQEEPFFCYIPYNTPHSPMMISDEYYGKFECVDPAMQHRDPKQEDVMMTRAALSMCENIDWNVGRVLKKLDELHLSENTIVVYFSDNGPNSYRWNGGMKGRKGAIDEGGLRSPFFIRWPGKIPSGGRVPQITGAIDLLPTLTALAGIEFESNKALDGRSFQPLLKKNQTWEARSLFAIKGNQVSVRTQRFRLDASGRLFDIEKDRGQLINVAKDHPKVVSELSRQAKSHNLRMQEDFKRYASRPFTVGYGDSTTLPARDGVEHGTIKRSSKAPNNSFFTHWTSVHDSITWDVDVGKEGDYEITVFYTCAAGDEGATVELSMGKGDSIHARVVEVFDPPLYDKSKERMAESYYFVKDFIPLNLGTLHLEKGWGTLRLGASHKPGKRVIDVHSLELRLVD